MKKFFGVFLASIFILTALFSPKAFAAGDQDYQQFTFADGNKANSYHWLTYVDTTCGMNTQAHYSAVTTKNISNMEVDWTAYNLSGAEQFWGNKPLVNTNYLLDTSKVGVIEKSYAQFTLKYKTQTWKPKGYAYHCGSGGTKSAMKLPNTSAENAINSLENTSTLPVQYTNINSYNTDDQLSIVKDTFNEFYAQDLSAYKLENGQAVTVDDLKIIETRNEFGTRFEDSKLQVVANKEDATNFSYVKVTVPNKVFDKNNKEYKLEGYILTSNGAKDKLDFGLIETEIQ